MNAQLKTVLLTVLTLSVFVIALVELSGISSTAFINKYGKKPDQQLSREQEIFKMPKTSIQFYDTSYNFGEIKEGDVVKHAFRFKNTGSNPLMIARADVSCGCTVPTFSKEPIAPGGEGEIMIQYNSNRHPGHQQKNIIVHSNAQLEAMPINFTADVKPK